MDTAHIDEMIETALAIEAKDHHLANYLEIRAGARGIELDESQITQALELFERYVRSVPALLSSATTSARGTPVEGTLASMAAAAIAYWDEPDDLVPDELGLLGLLDDAYFTLQTLQLVSDRLLALTGRPLIADDLSALDGVVREILGEIANVLDELVALSMNNAGIDELIAKVAEYAGAFEMPSAHTSFTGLSVVELVESRLSFASEPDDPLRLELLAAIEPCVADLGQHSAASLAAVGDSVARVRADIDRVLLAAEVEDPRDRDAAGAMLVGGLLARVAAGGALDREFVERCVDLLLGGL